MERVYVNGLLVKEDPKVEAESYDFHAKDRGSYVAGVILPRNHRLIGLRCRRGKWLVRIDITTKPLA